MLYDTSDPGPDTNSIGVPNKSSIRERTTIVSIRIAIAAPRIFAQTKSKTGERKRINPSLAGVVLIP